MDQRVRDLIKIGDRAFGSRPVTLWQALADNFYPERADFLSQRSLDSEWSAGLMTSFPVMARRDLGDVIASMMRPRNIPWFELHTSNEEIDETPNVRRYMEYTTGVMRRAIYDPTTGFVRATKQADHDWVTFGQAVILPSPNQQRDGLLYQSFHLKDCAWSEGPHGRINCIHRKWAPTVRQLCELYPGKVDKKVKALKAKEPDREINCRHIVIPREEYGMGSGKGGGKEYLSLIIDCENETILEEVGQSTVRYVIPRWHTLSTSPYARSPVSEIMLPDARTLQALTRIILEAGEKAVDPPMIAAEEVFRSDFDMRAGGLTWADIEADQRLGDKFATMSIDKSGLPAGFDIAKIMQEAIFSGFYLNKINLPPAESRDMTAYETRKRIEEHLRQVAPLFEPVEEDYNAPLLDETFEIMKDHGAFGPIESVPEELRGQDAKFTFQSPLREGDDELNPHRFAEGMQIIQGAAQFDPAQLKRVNMDEAVTDSLKGAKWPEKWLADPKAVEGERQRIEQQSQIAMGAQAAGAVADIAATGGKAAAEFAKAGAV